MHYLIGTDEAGYGPNLGPLTVAGTLWQVGDADVDLYDGLQAAVSPTPVDRKLTIADSKLMYSASGSISRLETSVLAILFAINGRIPSCWQDLIQMSCSTACKELQSDAWIAGQQLELPLAADPRQVTDLGEQFFATCQSQGISLLGVNCRPVFATEFNQAVDEFGNKASLLSSVTLKLAADLKRSVISGEDKLAFKIMCDKHGGRNKYAALLAEHVTDEFIWVEQESLEISSYRWTEENGDVRASFVARGESFLPTALSSMIAKYVREVFMVLWNNFWQLRVPELKATKGYPTDAKRFKKDIEAAQKSLGIEDETIWRMR